MLESSKNRTWIVFGLDHYSPLGMIRSFGELGIKPVYISVKNKARVATKSKYISDCYMIDDVEEATPILRKYMGMNPKPVLLATEDKTSQYIDQHYEELKDHFLTYNSAETAGRTTYFMDKKHILDIAAKHGIPVLDTVVAERGRIPSGLTYPVITKSISPNVGGWKSDVHICNNFLELAKACESIKSPEILIQRFVDKKNERCLDGFTFNHGKDIFISIDSHYMYNIRGYYSPFHDVKNFNDPELQEKLRSMFEEIGFEGIFSLEFIIDQDGTEYFSEVNFRQSTWSRCSALCGMNLSILWAEAMESGKLPENAWKPVPEGFTAMTEPIDYAKRVLTGRASLMEWAKDFREANCTYYYDKEDIEPFYDMINHIDVLM